MELTKITEIFHDVFDKDLNLFVLSAKTLACLIILIDLGQKMFRAYTQYGEVFGKEEGRFSPAEILRSVGLLLLTVFITDLLSAFDKVFLPLGNLLQNKYEAELAPFAYAEIEIKKANSGNAVLDLGLNFLRNIKENLSPQRLSIGFMSSLLWMLNNAIFAYFLAKRFFVMGIIKLLAPIIIALSVLDKFKELNTNLIKIYIRNLLALLPMILVMVFSVKIYAEFINMMYSLGGAVAGTGLMLLAGNAIKSSALFLLVILKIGLFMKTNEIMKSLIP